MKISELLLKNLKESLSDVEDKAVEVQDPVFADAVRSIKKADKEREKVNKVPKAEEHKETPDKVKAQPEAKKLHLSEDLFNNDSDFITLDESLFNESIITRKRPKRSDKSLKESNSDFDNIYNNLPHLKEIDDAYYNSQDIRSYENTLYNILPDIEIYCYDWKERDTAEADYGRLIVDHDIYFDPSCEGQDCYGFFAVPNKDKNLSQDEIDKEFDKNNADDLNESAEDKCCICGGSLGKYGNNAEPVKSGKCCDKCNYDVVLPARLGLTKNESVEGDKIAQDSIDFKNKNYELDKQNERDANLELAKHGVIKESRDPESVKKRVARYKEFDNGHIFHDWNDWGVKEAEEQARLASIEDPDDVYYVEYDDVMNPSTDIRWKAGKKYTYNQVKSNGEITGEPITEDKDARWKINQVNTKDNYYWYLSNGNEVHKDSNGDVVKFNSYDEASIVRKKLNGESLKEGLINSEIDEFKALCDKLGLKDLGDVEFFKQHEKVTDNKDLMNKLREFAADLDRYDDNGNLIKDEYGNSIKNESFKLFKEDYNKYKKSLNENVLFTETTPIENNGLASVLNNLIKEEWNIIQTYNDAAVNFDLENNSDGAQLLRDIINDENIHVGQLQSLLSTIDPSANSIKVGEQEFNAQTVDNVAEPAVVVAVPTI